MHFTRYLHSFTRGFRHLSRVPTHSQQQFPRHRLFKKNHYGFASESFTILRVAMSGSSPNSSSTSRNQSPGFLLKCTIKTIGFKFPSVLNVSTNCLDSWLASPEERTIVLLDCRPDDEYVISHIFGAIGVGHQSKTVEELVDICETKVKGKPNPTIVCYCSVGYRSSDTAQSLSKFYQISGKQPVPDIFNLEGSLFKWAQERRPMVDQNGDSTPFVHPYSDVFGKLVDKQLRKEKL